MRILTKTYLVIGIIIAAAVFNLFLLYQTQQSSISESYSIIKAGDLKVKAESITGLAVSIASGNTRDIGNAQQEKTSADNILKILQYGGTIDGQNLNPVPAKLVDEFSNVKQSWSELENRVDLVKKTMVFDPEATNAVNYVLEKNGDLILLADNVAKEIEPLDRDYNRHKEISHELIQYAQKIGQDTLLISIGESTDSLQLKKDSLKFEIGMRKLLGISQKDLDLNLVGDVEENLIALPRENSSSLRQLDPLWEAIKDKTKILEEKTLLSPEFDNTKNSMNEQKLKVFSNIDSLLNKWNEFVRSDASQRQMIVGFILLVDISLFILVIIIIRQSLSPLEVITNALSRVKEGVYGEKIKYSNQDEVGELVNTFNIMSDTIKEKDEENKRSEVAKDEFLAMITHELKTPLVPIQGYVDLILSEHLGKINDKQRERLSIIKSSSESLLDIISDLLDAQKLELGQLRMIKQNTDIKNTIEGSISTMNPKLTENEIKLEIHGPSIIVNHDNDRIRQVLTNLIKNSINVIQRKTGKIDIFIEDDSDEVRVSVKDNGIGIPLEKQRDLFKKFYQVDASLTRERGGSGLGLAICKGIIEAHGGKIVVSSTSNQGTVFTFTIPKRVDVKTPIGY